MHTRARALLYQQKSKHQGHIKGINPLYSKGEGVSLLAVQRAQEQTIGCDTQEGFAVQSPLLLKATETQKQTQRETQITTIRDGNEIPNTHFCRFVEDGSAKHAQTIPTNSLWGLLSKNPLKGLFPYFTTFIFATSHCSYIPSLG